MFSGSAATAGACGSPVWSRDSTPVTYSAPVSQQLAGLGRVDHVGGRDRDLVAGRVAERDRPHAVAVGVGGDRLVAVLRRSAGRRRGRGEHRLEHRERNPRLGGDSAHPRGAGVEMRRARAASVSG